MLFKNFKDFKEFKQLYVREDGKRKNAILLSFTTSPQLRDWYAKREMLDVFYGIKDMNNLFQELTKRIKQTSYGANTIHFTDDCPTFRSDTYMMDEQRGLCFDGDYTAYRYVKNGKPYKMKVGRLIKNLIDESLYGEVMPYTCKLWICEELGQRWQSYAQSVIDKYTLVVDNDFEAIYDQNRYKGGDSMGSCMENDGFHTFYNDAVDAYAASLRTHDGDIIARCVIYNKAEQATTGKIFRLAERQYAVNDNLYKRLLITKLIEGGFIDAYKPAGASCHEPQSWLDIKGNPLDIVEFSIPCHLEEGDAVSYQDSFKWYSPSEQRAYNYIGGAGDAEDDLETTSGVYHAPYDSWNEEYVNEEVYPVYSDGNEFHTTEHYRDEYFCYIDRLDQYHHVDDVFRCECCGVYELNNRALYSVLTAENYCCEECRDAAEETWREENEEE